MRINPKTNTAAQLLGEFSCVKRKR